MRHFPILHEAVAFGLIMILPVSCEQSAGMNFMDRAFVKQETKHLANEGVEITMSGESLHNPTAAIEGFHKLAEKQLHGAPYRYEHRAADQEAEGAAAVTGAGLVLDKRNGTRLDAGRPLNR